MEDATELAVDGPLWRFIGSKQSYALKWYKLNSDDDDDDDDESSHDCYKKNTKQVAST